MTCGRNLTVFGWQPEGHRSGYDDDDDYDDDDGDDDDDDDDDGAYLMVV
jgi:hypothetical protein